MENDDCVKMVMSRPRSVVVAVPLHSYATPELDQHISHRPLNGTWLAFVGTSQARWILLLTFVELIAGEVASILAGESRILHAPIP